MIIFGLGWRIAWNALVKCFTRFVIYVVWSPEGAKSCSQGREALEGIAPRRSSPGGATFTGESRENVALSGLSRRVEAAFQGLTPPGYTTLPLRGKQIRRYIRYVISETLH